MIKLIVGLGNPGARYQKTRHNAGFWLLDQLAAAEGGRLAEDKKFQGEYGKIALAYQPVHLLKPLTFMNASGRAVSALAKFYDLAPGEILVVHDELGLPEGAVKLKYSGGDDAIARGLAILPVLVRDGAEKAMHRLHTDG